MIDNKMMELIVAIAVILLALPATAQVYLFYLLYKDATDKDVPIEPERREVPPEPKDVYNPMYAEGTVPLENFQPHHSKPVKVKFEEEDQITPLNGQDN